MRMSEFGEVVQLFFTPPLLSILLTGLVFALMCIYIRDKPFQAQMATLNDSYIKKALREVANSSTKKDFEAADKPIVKQNGHYRSSFIQSYNLTYQDIVQRCFDGIYFSKDFCYFCNNNFREPKRTDVPSIIRAFLAELQMREQSNFENFVSQGSVLTPQEFFAAKSLKQGDLVGVYVIHNTTKDKYYVGQAKRLFFRINQHFSGTGNAYVFADYQYGDAFTIKIIPLASSGQSDLDLLERQLISYYNAYTNGYNRNRGNK